jgi:hypothetical protein
MDHPTLTVKRAKPIEGRKTFYVRRGEQVIGHVEQAARRSWKATLADGTVLLRVVEADARGRNWFTRADAVGAVVRGFWGRSRGVPG